MVNTVNWMDGLDGLAAGVTAIACAVLFIYAAFLAVPLHQTSVSLLPLASWRACLGFLPWNLLRRVFMGSSGACSWALRWLPGYHRRGQGRHRVACHVAPSPTSPGSSSAA